jgi:hypothetical protein
MFGLYAIVAQIVLQIAKGQQLQTAFNWVVDDGGILGDKNTTSFLKQTNTAGR